MRSGMMVLSGGFSSYISSVSIPGRKPTRAHISCVPHSEGWMGTGEGVAWVGNGVTKAK